MNNLQPSFRFAQRKDTGLILAFIKSLAEYEKMAGNVIATEELLEEWIFDKGKAEVLFVVENGIPVGFALFFHNFSTFLGRAGIPAPGMETRARSSRLHALPCPEEWNQSLVQSKPLPRQDTAPQTSLPVSIS